MDYSIIIPTLNEALAIVNCLTAFKPYGDNCEIIIADGGSTDETVRLAEPLADKVIFSEQGRAIQMNAGAENAKGNVLIFLHADTFLPDDAIKQISQVVANKGQWGRFDVTLSGRHPMLRIIAWFMNWRSRLTGIATGDQVIFVNKRLFESVGQFPTIALMEDIALSKKLKKISPPVCLNVKVVSSGRRWERFGVVKTILLMWGLRLRYYFGANPQTLAELYNKGQFWRI